MRVEQHNGRDVIIYESNDERLMAAASVIREIFSPGAGFVLIVSDLMQSPAPMSIDNFDKTEYAIGLVRSILDHYTEAQARTYKLDPDGSMHATASRDTPPADQESDDGHHGRH